MKQISVIGNLGRDAKIKELGGKNFVSFSLAETEKFKTRDGVLKERTTWFEVEYPTDMFSPGLVPFLKKGRELFVSGNLRTRAYIDNSGQPQSVIEIRPNNIQLIGKAENDSTVTKDQINDTNEYSETPF